MKNLINAITKEYKNRLNDFITGINQVTETEELLQHWRYKDLIPKGKDVSKWTIEELRAYLIKRKEKNNYGYIENQAQAIKDVFAADQLLSVKISVEWKKSKMWGSNPTAECWYTFKGKDGTHSLYIKSSSISGCGFDKLSTAVAECLNMIPEVLKPLYQLKEKNMCKNNRELFGYGSGHQILPKFEEGVGVSCYPAIFDKVGYKFETVASGKTFDVFTITIKENKKAA